MKIAFIMISTSPGKEKAVLEKVLKMQGVNEGWNVYGDYDILIKVEVDGMNELNDTVFASIRKMPDVRKTVTMLTI